MMQAILKLVCGSALVMVSLPAQVYAQSAPAAPATPVVVVVQQKPGGAPAAPAQPVVVVQQKAGAPGASAPAANPSALSKSTLSLDLPPTANLGQTLEIHAAVSGPDGQPVVGVPVGFSTSASFLNTTSRVVFAHAVTDSQGAVSVEWQPRSGGSIKVDATFAGDARFAAARTTAAVEVKGDQQLYQQEAGVVLPGVNSPPPVPESAATGFLARPLPGISGWPVVVVLLIIWSLYAKAASCLFTIARGRESTASGGKAP